MAFESGPEATLLELENSGKIRVSEPPLSIGMQLDHRGDPSVGGSLGLKASFQDASAPPPSRGGVFSCAAKALCGRAKFMSMRPSH